VGWRAIHRENLWQRGIQATRTGAPLCPGMPVKRRTLCETKTNAVACQEFNPGMVEKSGESEGETARVRWE